MTTQKKLLLAVTILVLAVTQAQAERWATADGGPPINPDSGLEMDPTFCYDPSDGLLYVFNAGPNGVDDTTTGGELGGDDFGFISLLLTASSDIVGSPTVLGPFQDGIAWSSPVFFNGQVQLTGNAIAGSFLPISEDPVPIIQLLPGLTSDDFRGSDGLIGIETGGNFSLAAPGSTLFSVGDAFETGAFKIIPEPTALGLVLMAVLGLAGFRRR